MNGLPDIDMDDRWIISMRSPKNHVDIHKPYALLVEEERTSSGEIEQVLTVFLTNHECPFRCLMCDLWKNTTDEKITVGTIPLQISYALEKYPGVRHIKLYNSGNFFDSKAIPVEDYETIATLLDPFETVVIECHPKLIDDRCLQFRDMLKGKLEVAIGLETAHPDVLQKLNKRMDLSDFSRIVRFLKNNKIQTRAFTLLKPPFLSEEEGVAWSKRTLDIAFASGVDCCVIIPTRPGNGALEWLHAHGFFSTPSLSSLEEVMEYGLELNAGRVFADLWDLQIFSDCPNCYDQRKNRLQEMNLHQTVPMGINCECSLKVMC
jgi:archaeosine synthase beta-subunit